MSFINSDYYNQIAQGRYSNVTGWTKIGYNPNIGTTEEDVWSAGGLYAFAAAAGKMELVSSDNTQDIGTVIKGDATGKGNLTLRADGAGATYSYITAGYTRARNQCYTVPAGKTLYVTEWNISWGYSSATSKNEYCRFYTRANVEPTTKHRSNSIFYPYTEIDLSGGTQSIRFPVPTMLPEKTDLRVVGIASAAGGSGASVLRGYLIS